MALDKARARECFERDGWKCRHCRSREGLHPHHMIYKSAGGPDDLWNLCTLCYKCHRQHHDGFLTITWGAAYGNGPVQFTRLKGYRIV
jgi:5-methylcytosine-specific restriction endonuclease McrA